jgi:hypothetical protein
MGINSSLAQSEGDLPKPILVLLFQLGDIIWDQQFAGVRISTDIGLLRHVKDVHLGVEILRELACIRFRRIRRG